ncbi:unnamed protein product [Heligmosomoides polygyrus]|uniref:Uncharacterized protein n=1 Tax=Heligmosomoides polygyrus TaxID=6339 RepID=A0A183FZ19_HELPZ|nr:unnamed protein product [Heligmosomoides polygyrus]
MSYSVTSNSDGDYSDEVQIPMEYYYQLNANDQPENDINLHDNAPQPPPPSPPSTPAGYNPWLEPNLP